MKCEVCSSNLDVIEWTVGRGLVWQVCQPCRDSGAFVKYLAGEFAAALSESPNWRKNPNGTWAEVTN